MLEECRRTDGDRDPPLENMTAAAALLWEGVIAPGFAAEFTLFFGAEVF